MFSCILKEPQAMTNPLHHLMNPSSIAIAGASNNFMKMGTMHALSILKDGFKGELYPLHPKEKTVLGLKAYGSVEELPVVPDMAILVVPASQVADLLERFGEKGTKSAIIITAGFGEMGDEGRRMQERLNEISRRYGIRFLGPNCMGIINSAASLNVTVMPYAMGPGSLGLASQSGTYVTQSLPYLAKRGIRFSKVVSVGNCADIDLADALEYLGEDDATRAVALYIEGLRDVPRFLEIARRITSSKPVIAQYVGGSAAGARSSLSHTGSLAAPDHLYDGLFRQAGIIRLHSIEELYLFGNMLAHQPPLEGRRIGVITNSGGPGSAMANALEKYGLEVPRFTPELQEKLRPLLPPHAPCGNPVDLTFSLEIDILSHRIPEVVLASGEVDGIVIHGAMRSGFVKEAYPHFRELINNEPVDKILAAMPMSIDKALSIARYGKPIAVSSFYDRDDDYTAAYQDHGIPVFDAPEKAAAAMGILLRYREVRKRKPPKPISLPSIDAEAARMLSECLAAGRKNLDEHESKALLRRYGVPVTEEILVRSPEEAEEACARLGLPLVLKATAANITHKTGKGLVRVGLASRIQAAQAFAEIQEAAGRAVPVIAYRKVEGEREFVCGLIDTPGFGPSVMFGLGGIFTEALADTVFRPAPLSDQDAEEMIHDIRAHTLLGPFRGMPAVNIQSLARIIHLLSLMPILHPSIAEIDLNPVIIEGAEPVAVDALIVLKGD